MLLPDIKGVSGVDWSKYSSLDENITINAEMPFWLYFTPNGNFGKINKYWEKIQRKSSLAEPYIACYFFDIDIKSTDYQTVEEAFEETLKICKERQFKVHFLVKSWGGVHWYIFVEPTARVDAGKKYKSKFSAMMKIIAEMFPGWDLAVGQIERLMRLPFSNHWKTGEPIPVELYRIDWEEEPIPVRVESVEDIFVNEYSYLTIEHIHNFAESITEEVDIKKAMGVSLTLGISSLIDQVNKIPIKSILKAIYNEPKDNGKNWKHFIYSGSHIGFEYKDKQTGFSTFETTMGYRIWEERNCINNFSTQNHSIDERPRGQPYAFLYYYFNKDKDLIIKFIKEHFKIQFEESSTEYIMPSLVAPNGTIHFHKNQCIYNKTKLDSKGHIKEFSIVLFDSGVYIKGMMESRFSLFWEQDSARIFYIMEKPWIFGWNNEFIIEFQETTTKFNAKYWQYGLVFKGQIEDLLDFYVALNNAVNANILPKYELLYLNGMYKDFFLLGNTFITPTFKFKNEWENIRLKTQPIKMSIQGKEHISVEEYYKLLTGITSKRVAILSYLTFIALYLWQYFWDWVAKQKQQFMLPWLFISGATHSGKSTLLSALKEWGGIDKEAVKKSIGSTPQPLKQMATDWFLVHYDEFTAENANPEKENLLRDIVNRTISARGTITGENIMYHYRASLLVDWERLPQSTSVVNRMIIVAMYEDDKKGTPQSLARIAKYSYMKDLIMKAYLVSQEDVLKEYNKSEQKLLNQGLSWRELWLNAYLLTINSLFQITSEEDVIDIIIETGKSMKKITSFWDPLTNVLSEAIIKNRFVPVRRELPPPQYGWEITVPMSREFMNEKFIQFNSIQKKYWDKVRLIGNKLRITLMNDDTELREMVDHYQQYFRGETVPNPNLYLS